MSKKFEDLRDELEKDLIEIYGPIISGADLIKILGFPTQNAMARAISKNKLDVPVFSIKNRRGKHALSKEIAVWLASQREEGLIKNFPKANDLPDQEV